jgi:hypothetical protein
MQSALAFESEQEGAVIFLRDRPRMPSFSGFKNRMSEDDGERSLHSNAIVF